MARTYELAQLYRQSGLNNLVVTKGTVRCAILGGISLDAAGIPVSAEHLQDVSLTFENGCDAQRVIRQRGIRPLWPRLFASRAR